MSNAMKVGIIGCGNISAAYMRMAAFFTEYDVIACADINEDAAAARADEFGLDARSIDALLGSDDIDVIVNLTIPAAHFEVSKRILEAGKHVYSEKPFILTLAGGAALAKIAKDANLRIGSAPDTFLGGSHQQARTLIDAGTVGAITSGYLSRDGRRNGKLAPEPGFLLFGWGWASSGYWPLLCDQPDPIDWSCDPRPSDRQHPANQSDNRQWRTVG